MSLSTPEIAAGLSEHLEDELVQVELEEGGRGEPAAVDDDVCAVM
jgi:hypothetical protein